MRLIYYYIILSFLFSDPNDPYFEIFELDKKTIKSIESGDIVTVKTDKNYKASIDEKVQISVPPKICHLFNLENGKKINFD